MCAPPLPLLIDSYFSFGPHLSRYSGYVSNGSTLLYFKSTSQFGFQLVSDSLEAKIKIISQFCSIGKNCGQNGDRLSKNIEKLPYLH